MRENMLLKSNLMFTDEQRSSEKALSFFTSNDFEEKFLIPEEYGKGCIETIRVRKDLGILKIEQGECRENFLTGTDALTHVFLFAFYLSGKRMNVYLDGEEEKLVYDPGDAVILSSPAMFRVEVPMFQHIHRSSISLILVESSLLSPFVEEFGELLPSGFDKLLEGDGCNPYYHRDCITPAMKVSLRQIQHCPYHGSLKQLYLEGKAMQLIVHRLVQLISAPKGGVSLSSSEIERVRHAKEILFQNIKNPPCLTELGRMVALNITKLKTGFRELFGETVFEFVRKQRMEQARLLLEEGQRNVTQVTYEVGYNNLSHFSLMFKKQFGVCPVSYLKGKKLQAFQ